MTSPTISPRETRLASLHDTLTSLGTAASKWALISADAGMDAGLLPSRTRADRYRAIDTLARRGLVRLVPAGRSVRVELA